MEFLGDKCVKCEKYEKGIEKLLSKFEDYPHPIDDWREYVSSDPDDNKFIIIIMTPVGRLWTFEVEKIHDKYFVTLIGDSWSINIENKGGKT